MTAKKRYYWTIVELNKLRAMLEAETPMLLAAEILQRPTKSCYYQARKLGVQRYARQQKAHRLWSEPEERELERRLLAGATLQQAAKALHRSYQSVLGKAKRLKIKTRPAGACAYKPTARLAWSVNQDMLLLEWAERRSARGQGGRRPRHDASVAECERRLADLHATGVTLQQLREAALASSRASRPGPSSPAPATPGS